MRQMTSNRMPPVGSTHVVPLHAVARMLGWSPARVRGVDDILRPIRAADGSRAYDVDRVLFFVCEMDEMEECPHLRALHARNNTGAPRRPRQ